MKKSRSDINLGSVFLGFGELAPAFGMIGTLIGLVNMLAKLDDPSAIGPAMAVALLTTLYGSSIANVFAIPIKKNSSADLMKKSKKD